ncbi:hypothetical protein [Harryflintia acetispora]|uniref:Uncharacterized protein n=1 Tax=Harryflintia acetispora TaxID=1849041 RepID=A0A9X8ULC2_9FIRM|nr:hypothetical protein [Harryflintia acetispora]TCL44709.1 hypothetical protein EDD78_102335 [Harryflintia acetispora]
MKLKTPVMMKTLGLTLHMALFLYLCAPAVGGVLSKALLPAILLLGGAVVLSFATRFNHDLRRIKGFLLDRLSGAGALAALLLLYIFWDFCNLSYSPIKAQTLSGVQTVLYALVLWAGILLYAVNLERLDNLLMNITLCGLFLAGCALSGVALPDYKVAYQVIVAGFATGSFFFLSAQYNNLFKGTVLTGLCALTAPALYQTLERLLPSALVFGVLGEQRQGLISGAAGQLRQFAPAEMLLGRGSGYDITLSHSAGVCNFLLADLLNGGVVRFALALAVWLCVGYCALMLLTFQRTLPLLYLVVLGMVLIDALFFSKTGFLYNPLFLLFCALIITEHTLIKKGQLRFQAQF